MDRTRKKSMPRALFGGAMALLAGLSVAGAQEPAPDAIVDAME